MQNLGNVDAPYTYFSIGIPEMGINMFVYNLHYLNFESNVGGAPRTGGLQGLPWATLNSTVDLGGTNATSGYVVDEAAGGFTGFTFNVDTYPTLRELHDHAFDVLKAEALHGVPAVRQGGHPQGRSAGARPDSAGPVAIWSSFGDIPDLLHIPVCRSSSTSWPRPRR